MVVPNGTHMRMFVGDNDVPRQASLNFAVPVGTDPQTKKSFSQLYVSYTV